MLLAKVPGIVLFITSRITFVQERSLGRMTVSIATLMIGYGPMRPRQLVSVDVRDPHNCCLHWPTDFCTMSLGRNNVSQGFMAICRR